MNKDLLTMAVINVLVYFDQRSDIHPCNPNAPNEEMRLWEELNHGHKEWRKERDRLRDLLKRVLPAAEAGLAHDSWSGEYEAVVEAKAVLA